MESLTNDTIGGYNSFIKTQQELEDPCFLTTYHFNDIVGVTHFRVPIKEAQAITKDDYRAIGGTALNDAIGTAISEVSSRIDSLPEEERPENVVFLIITDGEENSSKLFTKTGIKDMITERQDKNKWNFIYIGANVDQFAETETRGIKSVGSAKGSMAIKYASSHIGSEKLYSSLSDTMKCYRSSGVLDTMALTAVYDEKDETTN
jgi:uncharacterized protein YegL